MKIKNNSKVLYLVIWLLKFTFFASGQTCNQITISIIKSDLRAGDTLLLQYWENTLGPIGNQFIVKDTLRSSQKKGLYTFSIRPSAKFGYISLVDPKLRDFFNKSIALLHMYLVEQGDSVKMTIAKKIDRGEDNIIHRSEEEWKSLEYANEYNYQFSGRGSGKFKCRSKIDSVLLRTEGSSLIVFNYGENENTFNTANIFDKSVDKAIEVLDMYRDTISSTAYSLMCIDEISKILLAKWREFRVESTYGQAATRDSGLNLYRFIYKNHFLLPSLPLDDGLRFISKSYALLLLEMEYLQAVLYPNEGHDVFRNIAAKYNNELLQKLVTTHITEKNQFISELASRVENALNYVRIGTYRKVLTAIHNNAPGGAAYQFKLPDTENKTVSLSNFHGKVVFIDFWYTGCTACAGYFTSTLKQVEETFSKNKDVVFISISIDVNKETWKKSVKSGKYTSLNVVNLYTEGLGTEHPIIWHYKIVGYPRPLIIGKNGKLFCSQDAILKNKEKLMSIISAALEDHQVQSKVYIK